MNYRGSYRHLTKNAQAAMMAAIEIYNKPRIEYRDECFIILLLNAWELCLKAVISKNGKSIHYPKKRNEPHKTFSLKDSLNRAEQFFPDSFQKIAVRKNLELLVTYRDNAVHFYNKQGFGLLIYALAQTSIINFKDLLENLFGISLRDQISWNLMPLAVSPPIDPIEYISRRDIASKDRSPAIKQFITELSLATKEVEDANQDTGRLLTIFRVSLQSTKKIQTADVLADLDTSKSTTGPLLLDRTVDPNISHPLRRKDILEAIEQLHGRPLTSYVFQAIAWKLDLKNKKHLCWQDSAGALVKYSSEVPAVLRRLTAEQVEEAVRDYRDYMAEKRKNVRSRLEN